MMKGNQALTRTLANISLMEFFTDRLSTHSLSMWLVCGFMLNGGANDDINIMHVVGSGVCAYRLFIKVTLSDHKWW